MNSFPLTILNGVIKTDLIPNGPPGTVTKYILTLLSNGLILFFSVIILIAIFQAALAGLKYITSQGEAEKVEEAQNALKSVFIGLLAVFVGVIVVVILGGVFLDTTPEILRRSMCTFFEPATDTEKCVAGSV
jgi:hypothetical protein